MDYQKKPLPEIVGKLGWLFLGLGIIMVALSFVVDKDRAMFNYLIMYMFILSIALGSLGLVALEYLAGATWSTPFRRISEFFAAVLPLLIILVIPIIFGMHDLYHWTHKEAVAHDPLLQVKEPYLNVQFFIIRVIGIYAIWMVFYFFFMRNSKKQDTTRDPGLTRMSGKLAAAFAPLFMITITIAAIDFMMSLEPHWYSTIYGVYYFAGSLLASFAALTFVSILLKQKGYLCSEIKNSHFYSMGTLMFAFNIFWAYIGFSQYILIWYADIPEETYWYLMRWEGSWKYVSIGLIIIHFVIPFLILIPRSIKTNVSRLKFMAIWILVAHYYDIYWLVMPTYSKTGAVFGWIEIGFPILVVGLFMTVFNMKAKNNNLMPIGDPKLENGLNFHL